MEFRDLKRQYSRVKDKMDSRIHEVIASSHFILGEQVQEIEQVLADYVGRRFCISCANGSDALILSLMALEIGPGDAVFVTDFSYVASASCVSYRGAQPIFVDIDPVTFNMDPFSLKQAIDQVISEGRYRPRAVIPVDLFGLPADYEKILGIAVENELFVIEDAAQGFGGMIGRSKTCSFGDLSTTSFFPSKPLGCYGDGGAIFTDSLEVVDVLRSLRSHGRSRIDKYDNHRIGINSRLDTLQASVLLVKMEALTNWELVDSNHAAALYKASLNPEIRTPVIAEGFYSSWAQYTIALQSKQERDGLKDHLHYNNIPTMVYYPIPLHMQKVFGFCNSDYVTLINSIEASNHVLSLPMHPYLLEEEIARISDCVNEYIVRVRK